MYSTTKEVILFTYSNCNDFKSVLDQSIKKSFRWSTADANLVSINFKTYIEELDTSGPKLPSKNI